MMGWRRPELTTEQRFLKGVFGRYYSRNEVEPPYRFARREWGFFPFGGKMMFRHMAFLKREEISAHFRESVPMHAYYSTAYYGEPALQPMGEKTKTWMGADLIFDLDADHLPDAESMTYEQQLGKVKVEVIRLMEEFLFDDLGLPSEGSHLYFSGGRGYHVHVRSNEVLNLNSQDRRAIVDYITGRGIDFNVLFPKRAVHVNRRFGSVKEKRDLRSREWGGWVKRIYDSKDRLISDLEGMDEKRGTAYLVSLGRAGKIPLGEQKAATIFRHLFKSGGGKVSRRMVKEDKFQLFQRKELDETFLSLAVAYSAVHLSGETDEPVTTDIKRLIRVPTSLHGKTGFRVTGVDIDSIRDFDPLVEAVALPDDPVKVKMREDHRISMKEQGYSLSEGTEEVPLHLAYFLVARGLATPPP